MELTRYITHFYVVMYLLLAVLCLVGWTRGRQPGFLVMWLWAMLGLISGLVQQFGTELVHRILTRFFSDERAANVMTGAFSINIVALMGLLTLGVGMLALGQARKGR